MNPFHEQRLPGVREGNQQERNACRYGGLEPPRSEGEQIEASHPMRVRQLPEQAGGEKLVIDPPGAYGQDFARRSQWTSTVGVGVRFGACQALGSQAGRSSTSPTAGRAMGLTVSMGGAFPWTVSSVLDSAGRRRSPATMPGYHAGRPPRNKGLRYPADPPTVQEIIAVMREAGTERHGARPACPDHRALARQAAHPGGATLSERDLDPQRGSVLVRNGKVVGAGRSAWTPGA